MSKVRVLAGTRKGAFILTADGKRQNWEVSGPHFAGWELYHLKGSPADPNRIYASQTSGGSDRSFNAPTTAAKPGTSPERLPAKRSLRAACPKPTATNSGTTPPLKPANR